MLFAESEPAEITHTSRRANWKITVARRNFLLLKIKTDMSKFEEKVPSGNTRKVPSDLGNGKHKTGASETTAQFVFPPVIFSKHNYPFKTRRLINSCKYIPSTELLRCICRERKFMTMLNF